MTSPGHDHPTGVVLVGCGRIARAFHLPALRDDPAARLHAVVDPDPDARAAALEAAPGVIAVADLDRVVADPSVDAVVVATPTHRHAEPAIAALGAGCDVYVEKPLAPDAAEARTIVDAADAADRAGAIGFNFRRHPEVVRLRRLIADGHLGEVVTVRTALTSAPRELPAWKRDPATGGGALLDLATHHLDLVPHLLGRPVTAVEAAVRTVRAAEDTVAVTLHLDGGVAAQVMASSSAAAGDRIEVVGTEATAVLDRMARRRLMLRSSTGPVGVRQRAAAAVAAVREGVEVARDGVRPPGEPSFARALGAFVRGRDRGSLATLADGLAAARLVDAARTAAADATRVPVERS